MSEITPNTPNPVREDAYKQQLAEKLGIDPKYIPGSPIWHSEEEIAALAEMFSNMSGGSSGGGVLVVHETVTTSGDETIHTLDKTWQEINDAGVVVLKNDDGYSYYARQVYYYEDEPTTYGVEINSKSYECSTQNDYPSYSGSR